MIAGLVLGDSEKKESQVAFLGDETSTHSLMDTAEIVELIEQMNPEILAVNCGTELNAGELTDDEEKLKKEGYSFTPSNSEKKKVERLRAIRRSLRHRMEKPPGFIRFDPHISSEELALDGDASLESLGVETSDIQSSREFDAMIGAVTARFYSQNQYSDEGLIVPESVRDQKA